jgi:hypothetical protein
MFSRFADMGGCEIEVPFEVSEHGSAIVLWVSRSCRRAYVRVPANQRRLGALHLHDSAAHVTDRLFVLAPQ